MDVEVIDLNKKDFRQGVSSPARIFEVLGILGRIWRKKGSCRAIYFTVSESLAGNTKDLLIYLLCFRQLPRMVIHLHGGAGMREIMLGSNRLLARLNGFFLRRMAGVIILGQRHVEVYSNCVSRERIHIVPNFAQDQLFLDQESVDAKFRKAEPLRILFLSNLLPGKGHLELVEAFRGLDERSRARIEIDFAGGFESERQRSKFLCLIDGASQIRYQGTVHGEKKRQLLAQAHIFCLPTYYPYEGQPISLLEAYASGCAVITTDHSGIPDVFTDGVNGYEVEKRSAAALRRAIVRALTMPEDLHSMATANLRAAQLRFRTSIYARELVRIVSEVHERAG
ncbi:MAG: glycosyltransferase family 4 protein [Gammaproteobacteria bacterium]|nr:glycosyltransferase family 4 protein [Gammaproteobacteria bacterium]